VEEKELIEGCLAENLIFQEKLYRRFAPKMMGVCLRYAKDRYEAEDVLQEGFIKVFDNLKSYRGDGSLEGWVRRIVVNTAISNYHKNKANYNHEDIDTLNDHSVSHLETVSDRLNVNDLLKLINKLPSGYKMVFNLFAIEGFGHKEIADLLGITESTSKTQFFKARKYLQNLLVQVNE
jgi:RNA polymerase sigma-70 factor (ECF subfamily)